MKVCKSCGTIQGDGYTHCIECGEYLGSPVSKEEEKSINKKVSKNNTKLYNKEDYFYVSKLDKVIAALLIIGALISISLMMFTDSSISSKLDPLLLFSFILMIKEALDIGFPNAAWGLYMTRFTFSVANPDDIEPSELRVFLRRKGAYGVLIAGYVFLTIVLINMWG